MTTPGRYALDNDHKGAPDMLDCLSGILGANAAELLDDYLSADDIKWDDLRCLVLGAGNGSIAGWLADSGASSVLALDINTSRIHGTVRAHPRVEVVEADLLVDSVPAGPFDVVHARLLLAHLSNRRRLLAEVVDALAPGGVVMIEEWGVAGRRWWPGRLGAVGLKSDSPHAGWWLQVAPFPVPFQARPLQADAVLRQCAVVIAVLADRIPPNNPPASRKALDGDDGGVAASAELAVLPFVPVFHRSSPVRRGERFRAIVPVNRVLGASFGVFSR